MQSAAGIYYLLPLGVRIQDKIRRLADEAMKRVGIALSSKYLTTRGIQTGASSAVGKAALATIWPMDRPCRKRGFPYLLGTTDK